MKILEVISYLYPAVAFGGPGKLVREISESLSKKSAVTVYSTDAFDSGRRRRESDNGLIDKNVNVRIFRNISNSLAYRLKIFISPGLIPAALKLNGFDVVHFHEFFTVNVVILAMFARFFKVPYFISAHGTLHSFHLKNRGLLKKLFFFLVGSGIIKGAAGFIAATGKEAEDYKARGVPADKIHIVKNGIELREFKHLPPRGKFRKDNGIGRDRKIILYLGRINKLKGLDILIKAYALSPGRYSSFLVIAGTDDGYLKEAQSLVKKMKLGKEVIFTGTIDGRAKLSLYRDSDLFVYSSPSEGFSLAVLEAGACGLPLLLTEGCNFPEVSVTNSGKIMEYSLPGFKKGLESMLSKSNNLKLQGKNARKLVSGYYSIENMSRNLLKIYTKVLNRI